MRPASVPRVYLALSAAGFVLLLAAAVLWQADGQGPSLLDRTLVTGAFVAACAFGISLAARPNWPLRMFSDKRAEGAVPGSGELPRKAVGHHPDCRHFDGHRLVLGKRTYCTGCLGLVIGAILAIALAPPFLLFPPALPRSVLYIIMAIGFGLALAALVDPMVVPRRKGLHVVTNALLPPAFLLETLGMLALTGSALGGLLALLVSTLWMDARVRISKSGHDQVCARCADACPSAQMA